MPKTRNRRAPQDASAAEDRLAETQWSECLNNCGMIARDVNCLFCRESNAVNSLDGDMSCITKLLSEVPEPNYVDILPHSHSQISRALYWHEQLTGNLPMFSFFKNYIFRGDHLEK